MAHRAAVELSSQVAAIAAVSGGLMEDLAGGKNQVGSAKGPVSVLLLNGDSDANVAYCGQNNTAGISTSVDATFAYWAGAKANSCGTLTPTATQNPNALCDGNGVQTSIGVRRASSCLGTTEVVAYQLHGGIHKFYGLSDGSFGIPQGQPIPLSVSPGTSFEPYNPAFTATTGTNTVDICWTFFQGHSKH
jgi:poly(3-hydroxybutyrate) depolymerase